MSSEVLRTAGRFELLRQVGHGGMAVVYLARQTDLDRFVALKELRLMTAPDPTLSQRFLREAQMAGAMSHPNIVTVHEHFEHDGTPYIAMEYLERGSLRPYISRMTTAQIAGVLEGVLAGLDHAEGEDVVHRDLKPENLMVTREGRIKIADFGIARARNRLQTGSFMTAAGTTVGTPTYMAPEQAMARDIGPYTDLYSVGIIAYEMLVGQVPFHDTDTPVAILMRHINEQIQPAVEANPDVNPALSAWIDRLLVKDWRRRTPTAAQAWDELEDIVINLLGSRWRRDARLPEMMPQGGHDRPLTPAQFTATSGVPGTTADADFQSFAWAPAAGGPASATPPPTATPPAAETPPPVEAAEPPSAEPVASADAVVIPPETPAADQAAAPPTAEPVAAEAAAPPAAPVSDVIDATGFHTFGAAPAAGAPVEPVAPPEPEPPAPVAQPEPQPVPTPAPTPTPEPVAAAPAPPPPPGPPPELTVMPDAVPEPVATAAPERSEAPSGSPRTRALALAAAGVVSVVAGFVIGHGGGGKTTKASAETAPVPGSDAVAIAVPAGWSVAGTSAGVPELRLSSAVAAELDAAAGQGVVAGAVPAEQLGSGLLPTAVKAESARRTAVRIARGIEGYRYTGLRSAVGQALTIYTVPTEAGAVLLACHGPQAVGPDCATIAGTLRPQGTKAVALGADADVAGGLSAALGKLERDGGAAARTLSSARTPAGQASSAQAAAEAYATAARAVRALPSTPALTGLGRALAATSRAYARLGSAAKRSDAAGYRRAANALRAAGEDLAAARTQAAAAGYAIGGS